MSRATLQLSGSKFGWVDCELAMAAPTAKAEMSSRDVKLQTKQAACLLALRASQSRDVSVLRGTTETSAHQKRRE